MALLLLVALTRVVDDVGASKHVLVCRLLLRLTLLSCPHQAHDTKGEVPQQANCRARAAGAARAETDRGGVEELLRCPRTACCGVGVRCGNYDDSSSSALGKCLAAVAWRMGCCASGCESGDGAKRERLLNDTETQLSDQIVLPNQCASPWFFST